MNKNVMRKLISAMLAFTLCFADITLLGTGIVTAASAEELETQSTEVKKAEIDFDAYFQEEGTNKHSKDIADTDTLYLSLKIREGYLADAEVKITNSNFRVITAADAPTTDSTATTADVPDGYTDAARAKLAADLTRVESVSDDGTTIRLNKISNEESLILEIPIRTNLTGTFDYTDLSKTADVTLTGTYVSNGKEREIEKTIQVMANISGDSKAKLDAVIEKFVPFEVNGTSGTILQTKLTSDLDGDDLPINKTEFDITIPVLDGKSPDKITISTSGTKATNGKGAYVFSADEYTTENGHIKLTITNDDGKMTWNKGETDELILTYIYNDNKFEDLEGITIVAKSKITYYGGTIKTAETMYNNTQEVTGRVGSFATLDVETDVDSLYNGYMQTSGGKNTEFASTLKIGIGYSDLVDKMTVRNDASYMDGSTISYPSKALYRYTKIDRDNLIQILGEEGYINVYKDDGTIAIILNKDNLEYNYEEELSNLTFEISKPITEGILEIENGRSITPAEYSDEQIRSFNQYSVNLSCALMKDDVALVNLNKDTRIDLLNATTKAELNISKNPLSTVTENDNVEIRVSLNTDGPDSMLYKNPKIQIELPSYITSIKADNVKLLYEDEMKISDAKIYKNDSDCEVIEIALTGEQKTYNDMELAKGATLILESTIDVNELTPSKTAEAKLIVENEKNTEILEETIDLKFQAPIGMVTTNKLTGFNAAGDELISLDNAAKGKLDIGAEARTATITMGIINNYSYTCDNVIILGRIPFAGNKSVISGNDLGTTFDTKLVSTIKPDGISSDDIKVYYSENGEADTSLNEKNGWTEEPESLDNIKSIMITLNERSLNTGDVISFSYDIEIPADLKFNQAMYSNYGVYYSRGELSAEGLKLEGESQAESKEAKLVGAETERSADLKVEIHTAIDDSRKISGGTRPSYEVRVTNNSAEEVTNVTVKVPVLSNAKLLIVSDPTEDGKVTYTESDEKEINLNIDAIAPGESKSVNFSLKMPEYNKDNIDANKVTIQATVTVQGDETEFTSEEYTLEVITTDETEDSYGIKLTQKTSINGAHAPVGSVIDFELYAYSKVGIRNTDLKFVIPEGLTYVSDEANGSYDEATRTVTWHYNIFNTSTIMVSCSVDELPERTYAKDVITQFYMESENLSKRYEANPLTTTLESFGLTITQTCDVNDKYIRIGDEVLYTITVTNLSGDTIYFTIEDTISKDMKIISAVNANTDESITYKENFATASVQAKSNEQITFRIRAKAQRVIHDTEVTNIATANSSTIDKVTSNEIKHTILAGETPENPDEGGTTNPGGTNPGGDTNPDGTNPSGTNYSISGTAWIDSNKNGRRESDEPLVGQMTVLLLRSDTNKVVATTKTDVSGNYTFGNVQAGLYIVAFEYNTTKYVLTSYQLEGVGTNENSDAVDMTLTIDGTTGKYGVTNKMSLVGNAENIDIGLIDNPQFDLELEKTVSMIQISNSNGTKTYNFGGQDLAKIEIPEKQLSGTVVSITYTITVKNTGSVPGYANKIVDYKSKELTFNSSLNPEWYTDQSGNLYTTSLSNKLINPGETASVQVILTKVMTDSNVGQTTNDAEIAESSNSYGLPDADSKNNDKTQRDDDFSTANIIIAVNTGETYILLAIIFTVLAIFAFGAYEINKRVLIRIM